MFNDAPKDISEDCWYLNRSNASIRLGDIVGVDKNVNLNMYLSSELIERHYDVYEGPYAINNQNNDFVVVGILEDCDDMYIIAQLGSSYECFAVPEFYLEYKDNVYRKYYNEDMYIVICEFDMLVQDRNFKNGTSLYDTAMVWEQYCAFLDYETTCQRAKYLSERQTNGTVSVAKVELTDIKFKKGVML